MPRPKAVSSALRQPLDLILGSANRVRILRELWRAADVRSASDLARLASVDLSGLMRAMDELTNARLVAVIGVGRGAMYRLDAAHPFTSAIGQLFQLEKERRDSLVEAVGRWAESADPKPDSVLLFGSAARKTDDFLSDVDIALVVSDPLVIESDSDIRTRMIDRGDASGLAKELREYLAPVGERQHLEPSVLPVLGSELLAMERSNPAMWDAIVNESRTLFGTPADALVSRYRQALKRRESAQ